MYQVAGSDWLSPVILCVTWALPGDPDLDGLCQQLQHLGLVVPRGGRFSRLGYGTTQVHLDCRDVQLATDGPVVRRLVFDDGWQFWAVASFIRALNQWSSGLQGLEWRLSNCRNHLEEQNRKALISEAEELPQLLSSCPGLEVLLLDLIADKKELNTLAVIGNLRRLRHLKVPVTATGVQWLQEVCVGKLSLHSLHVELLEISSTSSIRLDGLQEATLEHFQLSSLLEILQSAQGLQKLTFKNLFDTVAQPVTTQQQTVQMQQDEPASLFVAVRQPAPQLGWMYRCSPEAVVLELVRQFAKVVSTFANLRSFQWVQAEGKFFPLSDDLFSVCQNIVSAELGRVARWQSDPVHGGLTWTRVAKRVDSVQDPR